jgi:hypothetical protein
MREITNLPEVLMELQELREQLVLAEAHRVTVVRLLRQVVQHPVNKPYGDRHLDEFITHEGVLDALRRRQGFAMLLVPGKQNRASPAALLKRHEAAVARIADITRQIEDLEHQLAEAGYDPL